MFRNYTPIDNLKAKQLLEDIKHTIDLNEEEIINLLIKNHTRSMEMNFKIEADSIVTMDIITTKAVVSADEITIEKEEVMKKEVNN